MRIRTLYANMLFLVAMLASTHSFAQSAKELVGTWKLVSVDNVVGGKRTPLYGPSPKGIFVLTPDNNYVTTVMKADLPKVASNNRMAGTPDENKAIVQGSIAHYGTYTVDPAAKSITMNVEAATFPNWNGTSQKRNYAIAADKLTVTVPAASTGSGISEIVYKRVTQ
ncbi:MAG: hypothetical protein JWP36_2179 [Paucimonas sp.]|nr:hypothetical protein [Paucimonas sp.]